jgi:hypothetical protein
MDVDVVIVIPCAALLLTYAAAVTLALRGAPPWAGAPAELGWIAAMATPPAAAAWWLAPALDLPTPPLASAESAAAGSAALVAGLVVAALRLHHTRPGQAFRVVLPGGLWARPPRPRGQRLARVGVIALAVCAVLAAVAIDTRRQVRAAFPGCGCGPIVVVSSDAGGSPP